MIRRYSLTWQKEWKICQKEDSAVITAMHFVWKKLLRKLRKLEQIILQQHFQSVRIRMHSGLTKSEKNSLINMG